MSEPILTNAFVYESEETTRIETSHRRIVTPLPVPESIEALQAAAKLFPQVNCYQPPILWDRAEGFQVFDKAGNCWIDFSSTAVTTNTGHAHPAIRKALVQHSESGLLAQFSFASEIRVKLARRLVKLAPPGFEKVYFWTVGSEAIEASLRLAREWGIRQHPQKFHILTHRGDYHGCTLGAHQLSGDSAEKPWLKFPDRAIHHLPFPRNAIDGDADNQTDWNRFFERSVAELSESGITPDRVAAVFIETMQGWGALPLPVLYMQRLRRWADEHEILLIFDEIQTGFGRTGAMFGHEHYGVSADLICIGKGLTSSLPLAAVLGPAKVLDVLPPGEITTTHAAHPLSCAAALANLDLLQSENLIEESARKGDLAREELCKLKERFPNHISEISGLGLLNAIHVRDPQTGHPSAEWARDWTWEAVKRGVMLFQTNKPTLKVCPPLTIPDAALTEGISALGDALDSLLNSNRTR
ncbi:MAG: aspartate aminotransferase family protein [Planctomycetes bacterium]|nr:aspartate aminotransferase family protein [Planctomycetota bacterium]